MDTPPSPAPREPVNGWLHAGGAGLAIVAVSVLASAAAERGSVRHIAGVVVFGVSAFLMFTASALYHLTPRSRRAPIYRRLDHAMIYVFIAGTYTPVCLLALREGGTWLLVAVWALAAGGVLQAVAWPAAPRGLSTLLYLGLGWIGVLVAPALLEGAPTGLFGWLLVGGVLYTVGAVVYWRKWPRGRPGVFGFHELWHVFVLGASSAHFWAILRYLIPST